MKGLKIFTILLAGLLLTGCGETRLTCSNSEESDGILETQEVIVTFKEEDITRVAMNYTAEAASDEAKEYWSMYTAFLEEAFETTEAEGVKLSVNNDDYRFNLTLEVDLTRASEAALSEYDLDELINSTATYDSIKAEAEENGFTCR